MSLLSKRHLDQISKSKKELVEKVNKCLVDANGDTSDALNTLRDYFKNKGFSVTEKAETRYGTKIKRTLVVSNNNLCFELNNADGRHISVGKSVGVRLVVTSDDIETLEGLRKEPYRFDIIERTDKETIVYLKRFGWTRL